MRNGMEAINLPSCGLDIHKDIIEACIIDEDGNRHLKTFDTMRRTLYDLKAWIISLKCFHVLMESTGVYWLPIYEILEDIKGMNVGVGNARHMRNVPGRPKTDREDSKWIARLCMVGLILKSFVVGKRFRELREYTRYYKKLKQDRARHKNRIEKLLQLNGFKLSSVISDIYGVSGLKLLNTLRAYGNITLSQVKSSLHKRIKKSPEEIERAINGRMKYTSQLLLGKMLARLDTCNREMDEIYGMMTEMFCDFEPQLRIIESIPGMGRLSGMYIIAEIGTDLSSFRSSGHLAAWAGLAPKDHESAGKLKFSKTKKANIYVKSIMIECAWAAIKVRNTRISNWYWRNVKRLGEKKAITAVARKLMVYIYAMLKNGELYDGSLDVADTEILKAEKLASARKTVERQLCDQTKKKQRSNETQKESTNALLPAQANLRPPNIADTLKPSQKKGRHRKNSDTENLAHSHHT